MNRSIIPCVFVMIFSLASCHETRSHARPASSSPPTTAPGIAVSIDNFSYSPREIVVEPGTRITWTNHDDVPHTVSSADKSFKSSAALDTDDTFSMSFVSPGTYRYFCAIHPHMTGVVVVRANTKGQ